MTFQEVLAQVIAWLQREQRVSYRALKRQFALDDDYLEDLKDELIYAKHLAMDEDGRVLVWTGDTAPAPPARESAPAPLAYTPPHLTDKILVIQCELPLQSPIRDPLLALEPGDNVRQDLLKRHTLSSLSSSNRA